MIALFSCTLFVSAFLLFCVQLMVAKMILPLLGGSPSVWNTCQFFFQAILLLGYGYSHLTTRWLDTRRQAVIHSILLFVPIAFLPIAISKSWVPPHAANPIPWLLGLLIFSVGFPFFVVSTSAPLIQKWFAHTGHPSGDDPYFLYSASNLGSMLGLLGYPIIIEPYFSLTHQSKLWATGYGLLILLTLCCGLCLWRSPTRQPRFPSSSTELIQDKQPLKPPTVKQKAQWVLLSFIPSSLLLGVTTYLTTDLAAIPLLWAVPLAIYLLTFILTFARKSLLPHHHFIAILPLISSATILVFVAKVMRPVWLFLPLHLIGFFITASVLHGELARRRPPAQYLTNFYLWISVGGALGGWFNAIAAPLIFPSVLEYPIVLLLTILLLQSPEPVRKDSIQSASVAIAQPQPKDLDDLLNELRLQKQQQTPVPSPFKFTLKTTRAIALGLLFGALIVGFDFQNFTPNLMGNLLAIGLWIAIYSTFSFPRRRLVLGIIFILLIGQFSLGNLGGILESDRSFFGVNRVVYERRGPYHSLLHGTTLHGRQSLDPQRRREPLTYFHPTGPIGQVFTYLNNSDRRDRIAVLGLGIGTLATYSQPGQVWTFYEIDPTVEKIARDSRYFTFLQDSKAPFSVVLGDARLRLAEAADNTYDLLVMDAFSSDSIPVHLVTREAIQLYFTKLTEQGLLAINISNRYINLEPVLSALAQDLGLATLRQLEFNISPEEKAIGKSPSHWVLMARKSEDFGALRKDSRWQPIPENQNAPVWTDDFSNIFSVLRAVGR